MTTQDRQTTADSKAALETRLNQWAEASKERTREAGTAFEHLCAVFLANDPVQSNQFENPRPYAVWAEEQGLQRNDRGIDLVADLKDGSGKFAAIQCKFRREGGRISEEEIAKFIAASNRPEFAARLLIETSGRDWTNNAEKLLSETDPKVTRIGRYNLFASDLDWSIWLKRGETPTPPAPSELRSHQKEAVKKITKGLAEPGTRGKALMACGTGKTLTSLRVAESIAGEGGRILYLVPSLALMSQTINAWMRDRKSTMRIFAVCSDASTGRRQTQDDTIDLPPTDLAIPATTDAAKLAKAASKPSSDMTVVFATYQSSGKIAEAQREHGLPRFDLAVCDEAHRTAGKAKTDQGSDFTLIHDNGQVQADRRLYMTATPKIWSESAKKKAGQHQIVLWSMDDTELFGETLYEFDFHQALEAGLLSDYRVVILTVPEDKAALALERFSDADRAQLKLEDAGLMLGCQQALAKGDPEHFPETDRHPMKSAIAFCSSIRASKQVEELFGSEDSDSLITTSAKHVDGTYNAEKRSEILDWLEQAEDGECRVVTNARCLSEGVDVPALDALLFMQPRKSQIEVVQAVGRVMRRAAGKQVGYVILPVVIPEGKDVERIFEDSDQWKKVWQMINAIRSHDDGFEAQLNLFGKTGQVSKLSIITVSQFIGLGDRKDPPLPDPDTVTLPPVRDEWDKQLTDAIRAKLVEKCGNRKYWEDWAVDVADIARRHITRITALVTPGEGAGKDTATASEMFDGLLKELRDDINPTITREQAIEMLAQHSVTLPVFRALFDDGEDQGGHRGFLEHSAVGRALESFLDVIQPQVEVEAENLGDFYRSVENRVKAAGGDAQARQKIVSELYDKFFRNAFAETSKELGIVYTPVELVDFVLHSVEHILKTEFDRSMGDGGVIVMDPFSGTGTFMTRLIQSGMIDTEQLRRKYMRKNASGELEPEILANEIVLLAYYISSVNIQQAFASVTGEQVPFEGICLTDTFQMAEKQRDMIAEHFEDNSRRRQRQMDAKIDVVVSNPPWNAGKSGPDYAKLKERITETYAAKSNAANKNSLYDSYKMAIRWASDRIEDCGVIGFVTNGSWLDGNAESGVRACLAEEFSTIHVIDLKGNIRSGNKNEGGNVFDVMVPVTLVLLVKNPAAQHKGCHIFYHNIGDVLTRKEKIERIVKAEFVTGIEDWERIKPDKHHSWINKREKGYEALLPLGSKEAKAGKLGAGVTVFQLFSNGLKTGRDAYLYNFSLEICEENAKELIADQTINQGAVVFHKSSIRPVQYRPFIPVNCYADASFIQRRYQQHLIFPTQEITNRAICLPGISAAKSYSTLMVDCLVDLNALEAGTQCFPRYRYVKPENSGELWSRMNEATPPPPPPRNYETITVR